MGQIKANIKPEYTIKENERYAWVWRCVRLTTIPGQPRQDVREWNYVAFNERDHLRFKDNFRAANVHEAFLIHDGRRQKEIDNKRVIDKEEIVERAKVKLLEDMTKRELLERAREEMVEADARMTKKEIIAKIRQS